MSSWLNVPNGLTLIRLLLLAPAIVCVRGGHGLAAAWVFLAAMLTDVLDGRLARRLNQRTLLGLYLDPLVDKIVILALLYEVAATGVISAAVPHLFLARELLHDGLRAFAAGRGTLVGANWMGKTKAFMQTVLILWALAQPALTSVGGRLAAASGATLHHAAWLVLAITWLFFLLFLARNHRLLAD
jgi:CDP-diacylglycerol--glycerol-3-phosphate 3-phosphatidyltransferase